VGGRAGGVHARLIRFSIHGFGTYVSIFVRPYFFFSRTVTERAFRNDTDVYG